MKQYLRILQIFLATFALSTTLAFAEDADTQNTQQTEQQPPAQPPKNQNTNGKVITHCNTDGSSGTTTCIQEGRPAQPPKVGG